MPCTTAWRSQNCVHDLLITACLTPPDPDPHPVQQTHRLSSQHAGCRSRVASCCARILRTGGVLRGCLSAHPHDATSTFPRSPTQELSSTMGLLKLNERLGDRSYGEAFDGVFPKTSPQGGCVWAAVTAHRTTDARSTRTCLFRLTCVSPCVETRQGLFGLTARLCCRGPCGGSPPALAHHLPGGV